MKSAFVRYFLSSVTTLAIVVGANSAFAMTFEEAVGQAKTAYDAGDYVTAVDLLIQANRIQPNGRLLLNIARSYAKAGDCAKSVAYYRAFARSSDADAALVKTANKEAIDLKCTAFNSDTSGRVLVDSTPSEVNVSLDGTAIGTTPFEVVLVPKGQHTFRFEKDGYEPVDKVVTINVNEDADVKASLSEVVVVAVVEKPIEEPIVVERAERDMTPYYIAGGVTGVGVALLVTGIVYDNVVIPGTDDERKKYAQGTQDYKDLTDQRSTESTIALVGYVGGAALTVGGAAWLTYLFLTEDSATESKDSDADAIEKRLGVIPVIGQDTVGVGLFGQF